jgi:hypothetical protein
LPEADCLLSAGSGHYSNSYPKDVHFGLNAAVLVWSRITADVLLSRRFLPVIVVAGDVDGAVGMQVPAGLRDGHRLPALKATTAGMPVSSCRFCAASVAI